MASKNTSKTSSNFLQLSPPIEASSATCQTALESLSYDLGGGLYFLEDLGGGFNRRGKVLKSANEISLSLTKLLSRTLGSIMIFVCLFASSDNLPNTDDQRNT